MGRGIIALRWAIALGLMAGYGLLWTVPSPDARKYPNRIPVRFWHRWTGEWNNVVNNIVARFNESQEVYEVIPLSTPSSGADSKFILAAIGGDPPDVMSMWSHIIPTFAGAGLLTDLSTLMTPEEERRFLEDTYPVVRGMGMYKGKIYGITIGTDMYALYYHPQHLRDAGLDPDKFPDTLEELLEWGAKLDKFDRNGNLIRLGFMHRGFSYIAPAFGGGFYNPETGELTLDTPENLRALESIVIDRQRLGFENVAKYYAGLDTGSSTGGWPFISGAFSITFDGQWRVEELRKYAPDMEYRTAPIPPPKGGISLAGYGSGNFMIVPSSAKQKEGAWEFVKFWSGLDQPERAAEFYTWGGWLPLSPAVTNSPIYQEYLKEHPQFQTFIDLVASENVGVLASVPYQVFLTEQIYRAEDLAVRGSLTSKEALRQLDRTVRNELAKRKSLGYQDD